MFFQGIHLTLLLRVQEPAGLFYQQNNLLSIEQIIT